MLSLCCIFQCFELCKIYTTNEPRHDKINKVSVRPAKTQISLGIRPVWSESSLCAQWVAKDPIFLHADSEDSDQTGQMPRLIWVFAGRKLTLLVLSCRGSNALEAKCIVWHVDICHIDIHVAWTMFYKKSYSYLQRCKKAWHLFNPEMHED